MKIREEILEFETFYHIYNRGINSQNVFLNTDNYSFFLQKAEKYLLKYFDIFAYCLMPNHFHFIVKTKSLEECIMDKIENVIDDNLIFSKTIGSF